MIRSVRPSVTLGLGLMLTGSLPAAAQTSPAAGLSISDPWMRALTQGLPAAGYFTLANSLDHSARLVGAASPACGSLTLHQTTHRHVMGDADPGHPHDAMSMGPGAAMSMSMSAMQPVVAVAVPAHGTLRFMPGGYHLMCEQPTPDVQPGHSIPVTLQMGDGSSIATRFPVRGPRG